MQKEENNESLEETSNDEVTESEVEESPEEETTEEVSEWSPNYKFKVMDQEHEMDEFIRPVINAENYDKVKQLYEKAYGLDFVKNKYQTVKEEFDNFKNTEYTGLKQNLDQYEKAISFLGTTVQQKDYETLMQNLNIPKEDIINLALKYVNYQNLPPDQKLEYDRNIESKQRLYELEQQNSYYEQNYRNSLVQNRAMELDTHLNSANIQEVAKNYDAGTQPGAFRKLVIDVGIMAAARGEDLPVDVAVQRAMAYVPKYVVPETKVEVPQSTPAAAKPYIPKVKGSGNTPVAKKLTSLDAIRSYASKLNEMEN